MVIPTPPEKDEACSEPTENSVPSVDNVAKGADKLKKKPKMTDAEVLENLSKNPFLFYVYIFIDFT